MLFSLFIYISYWNQCYFLQEKWKNLSKFLQNIGKFILYSLTFSQEIRVTGIVILIAINLLSNYGTE